MAAALSQTIEAPQAGQTIVVRAGSLRTIAFSFNLADAVVQRFGAEYIIRLPNGGIIILRGIAEGAEDEPVLLLLPDGSSIPLVEAFGRMGAWPDADPALTSVEGQDAAGPKEASQSESGGEAEEKPVDPDNRADADSDAGGDTFRPDLLADGQPDISPDAPHDAHEPGPNQPMQNQDGNDSGGASAVTSGAGEFRSDTGNLTSGVWALPDQNTHVWGWDNGSASQQEGQELDGGSGGPAYVPGTSIILSGGTVNESEGYALFTVAVTARSGAATLTLALNGGSAVAGSDYEPNGVEYRVSGGNWTSVIPDGNGHYVLPVTGNDALELRLPITMENHLEGSNATIGLAVVSLTGANGSPLTDYTGDTRLSCHATVTDDSRDSCGTPCVPHEKDGPLISIVRDSNEILYEDSFGTHVFRVDVKDCFSAGVDYCNPDNSGLLAQDITIVLQLDGRASLGADYTFTPSADMQDLIGAGKMTVSGPDAQGNITVVLHGQYNSDGSPSAKTPLEENDFSNLRFEAGIIDDGQNELPENIRLTILSVRGNEAQIGADTAQGKIADDVNHANGPVLSLTTESNSISESASPDSPDAPANNTNWHAISLHAPAPESIRVIIELTGNNGAVLFDGNNAAAADFRWAGQVQYSENGTDYFTLGASSYIYNPASGTCELIIPAGATDVRFAVTIIDDLREADESGHTYDVSLSLVLTNGMADCDAVLNGNPLSGSLTENVVILPDPARGTDLNPSSYDGPYVKLEANTAGLETNAENKHFVPESGGSSTDGSTLPFTLSLHDPDGSGDPFSGNEEAITVTLTISGSDGFQLQDLFTPESGGGFNGSIPYTVYDDSGGSVGSGFATCTGVDAQTGSASFQLTFPPGANTITFELPVNDDALGGASSTTSAIERLEETVTVTITGLSGNEARVDSSAGDDSASLIIRDDTDLSTFEGIQVGLDWNSGVAGGLIQEGVTGVIALKLFEATGNTALNASNSPYANYTGSNTTLPEDLTITLNFTDTDGGGDLALMFSTAFLTLVDAGKITVTINGTEYSQSAGNAAQLGSMELTGEFGVTLKGGSFTFGDASSLTFNAHVFGDNVNEYDAAKDYVGEHTTLQESFDLKITGVSGNESVIKNGTDTAGAIISDAADGTLTLSGGALSAKSGTADGFWSYTVTVGYSDNEKSNAPATAGAAGSTSGNVVTLPGEDIALHLRVTDGGNMQHGEEYTVSAYELFLSVNGLQGDDALKAAYQDYLDGNADALPANSWIIVTQIEGWNDGSSGSALFEFSVPKEYWDSHTGGAITFDIAQGEHLGGTTSGGSGGFTVELEAPGASGLSDWAFKGEITDVVNQASPAAEDKDVRIEMSLAATPVIYENAGSSGSNVAAYTMVFTQYRDSQALGGELKLACGIGFDFTLKLKTAVFNKNPQGDNLYDTMGDFAVSDAAGNLYYYDVSDPADLSSLEAAIQAIFDNDPNYDAGDVTVRVTLDANGDYKLSFAIKEGVDLTNGINLYFVAMDDSVTDSNSFSAQISNVYSEGNAVNISIYGTNTGSTTIRDESGDTVSGFAIAIGDGAGYEKLVGAKYVDGEGVSLDGKIHMPLYAYILSNGNMPGFALPDGTNTSPADGSILSLADLITIYKAKTGDDTVNAGNAAAHDDFRDFVVDHFKPTQPITVSMELTGSSDAAVNADFQDKSTQTVDAGSAWKLVIDGDGFVYFENELTIDSINDYTEMSGGEISFTVEVTGSDNNESRPVNMGDSGKLSSDHGASATASIKDFHDGPYIVSAGPADNTLYEPVDGSHNGTVAPKANAYTIQLNRATEEDMVVWLKIEGRNGAREGLNPDAGDDYFLGSGIYRYTGDDKCVTWNGSAYIEIPVASLNLPAGVSFTDAQPGDYFLVIGKDTSSASFDINVLDDNKTELGEQISIEVIRVEGGEATYLCTADGKEYSIPWSGDVPYLYAHGGVEVLVDPANKAHYVLDGSNGGAGTKHSWAEDGEPNWLPKASETTTVTIADDGLGPQVNITDMSWPAGGDAPSLTLTLEDACQENVEVSITLTIPGAGSKTLTFTFEVGAPTTMVLSDADILAAWNSAAPDTSTMPPRGNVSGMVQVKLSSVENGEAVNSGDERHVIIHHGTDPVIWLSNLQIGDDLQQAGSGLTENYLPGEIGDYGTISLDMSIPTSGFTVLEDVTFTIMVPGSGAFGSGTAAAYTVTIPQSILLQMQTEGGNVTITLTPDGDGKPVLTAEAGGQNWGEGPGEMELTTTGGDKLPALKGDAIIGEEGGVTCFITDNTGAYLDDNGTTVEYVRFHDNTFATIKLFVEIDGVFVLLEDGAELSEKLGAVTVKAVLVLTNAAGDIIGVDDQPISPSGPDGKILFTDVVQVTTDAALEFSIRTGGNASVQDADGLSVDDAALPGSDYNASSSLRIPKDGSEAEFVLNITQDDKSEGKEGFSISLVPTQDTESAAEQELGRLTGDTDGGAGYEFGRTDAIIIDDDSGPVISWDISTHETPENGSITLTWESHLNGGRQVVVEDVKMVFELTPADGFTLEEIASITVNGTTYSASSAPLLSNILTDSGGGTWLLTLPAGLNQGEALGYLTIKLQDDVKSEGTEKLSIQLKSVQGGETTLADKDQAETVAITETVNGPKVDLVAVSAGEVGQTDSAVIYKLVLQGGSPTGEEGEVVLKLNAESKELFELSGGKILITLPNGSQATVNETPGYSYDSSTGEITVTIPQGSTGGGTFTVTIPITDDALSEERTFGLSIMNIVGGEMTASAAVAYSAEFVEESAEVGGLNAFNEYIIKAASNPDCHASLRFEVTGIADESVIDTLWLGGKALVKDEDWKWEDGKIVVTSEAADMLPEYSFKIIYKLVGDNDPEGEALIGDSKANMQVVNIGMADREVVIAIANESLEADKDGPKVLLALPGSATEGELLNGAIVVTMPGLPGDGDVLLEDITITLTVPDADLFDLSAGVPSGCTLSKVDGTTVTVTVPAGTPYTGGPPPTIEIAFEALMPDNSLNDNPSYAFSVDDVAGAEGVYEKYGIDPDAQAGIDVQVTDNSPGSGPVAALEISAGSVEEGTALTGLLIVQMPDLAANGDTLAEDLTITVTLSPTDDFSLTTLALGGKNLILDTSGLSGNPAQVSVTIPKGAEIPEGGKFEIGFTADVPDNSLTENDEYTVAISALFGSDGKYETYTIDSDAQAGIELTVTDEAAADGFLLTVSCAQDAGGNSMTFNIALAAQGDYFNSVTALSADISFDLDLTGFTDTQIAAIVTYLNSNAPNVSIGNYTPGDTTITVVLAEGYEHGTPLSFAVDAQASGPGVGHVYEVAITNVVSGLEVAGVDSEADSAAVTLNLTLGDSLSGLSQLLYGGDGDDIIYGGDGDDIIYGGGGYDIIYGGDGHDVIYAGSGGAEIEGGDGNDVIFAGNGIDILNGGDGEDLFVWDKENFGGADTINQFTYDPGNGDMIGISGIFADQGDLNTLLGTVTDLGGNAFGFTDAGNSITAVFTDTDVLELTIEQGGQMQNITVNADSGGFYAVTDTLNETLAQTILENILKTYSD